MSCTSCKEKELKQKNQKEIHLVFDKLSIKDRIILENYINKESKNSLWVGAGIAALGVIAIVFEFAFFMVV